MLYFPKPPLTWQMQIEFNQVFNLYCVVRNHRYCTLERLMIAGIPEFAIARDYEEARLIAEATKPYFEQIEQAKQEYFESEKIVKTLWNYGTSNGMHPYYA